MQQFGFTGKPPDGAVLGESVPLEMAGSGKEIAAKVRAGKAVLEILSTPWGIEFYIRDVVKNK